jgi:hypothetical protein
MARTVETEYALSVYRKFIKGFIAEYLDDIPEELDGEDIAITTKRAIKKAIMPLPKDSAVLAVLRMKIFEEYRDSIGGGDGIVLLPDNWQAKMHQFPPQFVVGLGEVISGEVGRTKWTFTIPHYKHDKNHELKLPRLQKGNWWARFVLKDNSRVYINAETAAEGKNFIMDIIPLIDPKYVPDETPPKIDTGERGGSPIREVLTQATYGAFYKSPTKDPKTGKFDPRIKPDWTISIGRKS